MSAVQKNKLLLVEDEVFIAEDERLDLEERGYAVRHVISGEMAVEAALNPDSDIDLVLMDINLGPGMDGTEAARRILEKKDIPIVFLSSHTDPAVVQKTEQITSYGYVVKKSGIVVLDASIKMAFRLFEARIEGKRKQAALEKKEEQLALALHAAESGIWDWLVQDNTIKFNDLYYTMAGYEDGEFPASVDACKSRVHPDDSGPMDREIARCLAGEISAFDIEFRFRQKDGSWMWIRSRGKVVERDNQGDAVRFIGTHSNITAQKASETALRESEERFRNLSNLTYEGILLHSNGIVIDVNDSLARLTGYTREELIGQNIISLCVSKHCHAAIEEAIQKESTDPYEVEAVKKDGSRFIVEIESKNIRGGASAMRVTAVRDISERVSTEQKKQQKDRVDTQIHQYILELQDCPLEDIYRFIASRIRKILSVKYVYISSYEADTKEMVVQHITTTERENTTLRAIIKEKLTGSDRSPFHRIRVDETVYTQITAEKVSQVSSLYGMVFERIPQPVCSLIEKAFGIGWMQALAMISEGNLFGIIGLIGHRGQEPPERQALLNIVTVTTSVIKRRQAEHQLQENRRWFNQLLEQTNAFTWKVDQNGLYTELGASAERILGYAPDQLVGKKHFYDLHPSDGREAFRQRAIHMIHRREPFKNLENRVRTRSGDVMWVRTSGIPLFDGRNRCIGYWGIDVDMSGRKMAEEALKESEERYRMIFDAAPYGILLSDWKKVTGANRAFFELTGFSSDEILGCPLLKLPTILDHKTALYLDVLKQVKKGRPLSGFEFEWRHKSGEIRYCRARVSPFKEEDRHNAMQVILEDTTEARRADMVIQQQLREKELLLREVHHRIKNNMATITSLLNLQARNASNPEISAGFQEALSRIDSMRIIYDKLLLTEKYKALPVRPYIADLAGAVVSLFSTEKAITLTTNVDDVTLNTKLLFPLGLIINELLTNSLKYGFAGRERGTIDVTLKKTKDTVTLVTRDNGSGFPEDSTPEGSGFGLRLVNILAEQLNGTFTRQNDNGARCEVTFTTGG